MLAVTDDAPEISALSALSFAAPWSEADIASAIADPQAIVLITRSDSQLLAYAICYHAGGEGELCSIASHPDHRRSGLGRTILMELINELKAQSMDSLFLEVRVSNKSAIGLYTSMGFERIGVRKAYYSDTGEDAILMKIEI